MRDVTNVCDSGRRVTGGGNTPPSKRAETTGSDYRYPTKSACIAALVERMGKYPSAGDPKYVETSNYSGDYNSWLMSTNYVFTSTNTRNWAQNGLRDAYYEQDRTIRWATDEGFVSISSHGWAASLRGASNALSYDVFTKVRALIPKLQMDVCDDTTESNQDHSHYSQGITDKWTWMEFLFQQMRGRSLSVIPRVQSDEQTEQGVVNQESDKQSNTIITQDQAESRSSHFRTLDLVAHLASSEPQHQFASITNRWMPMDSFTISTSNTQGELIKSYYLPEAFYIDDCAPNLIPFETFIYGRMDVEIRLVANANKFCCGKALMSAKYDTYQADAVQEGYQSALSRNHVIIDLCANNEGVMQIPFRYHRPYVRLVKNDSHSVGVRPSKYASLYLHILSPLQTGTGGASEIGVRLFFRLKKSSFTGMSYRVKVQMDIISDICVSTAGMALKDTLKKAEKEFDQLGKSRNQDKPSQFKAITVVPQPRLNFSGGVGVADIVPLRVNPHTLTNYKDIVCPSDEPRSFYDLARIWGVIKSFSWSATNTEGSVLCDMIVDPTSRNYTASEIMMEMTPLEYACGNFALWSGPIEIRIDFVSTAYHTGTVLLSAEFGRPSSGDKTCESSSAYTKIFHLGEQKSVTFTVPYIYDTVMRRTTANFVNPYNHVAASDALSKKAITLAPLSKTHFKVRVLNLLRPISSASQKIDCLVFIRAGKNFYMHGLKGNSYTPIKNIVTMDEFPFAYPIVSEVPVTTTTPASASRKKRSTTQEEVDSHKQLPDNVRNEWNEYKADCLPRFQMDNGEKENLDTTEDFSQGFTSRASLSSEDQTSFTDLLRRPTMIMSRVKVTANQSDNSAFFIPLQPPGRQMSMVYSTQTSKYSINGDWAPTIGFSSATAIMDMFRCWRGSQRYTIVTYGATEPFYVSTIPHSGVRLLSTHQIVDSSTIAFNMAGFNFTTAIVVPSINPTITVEAPYETENTWTLSFDEDTLRNYSWRDKGDYNSGHLMISTNKDFYMDVWWSAGDDFEVANFYGVPYTGFTGNQYRLTDAHAKVQMDPDFQPTERATKVSSFCKTYLKPAVLAKAAVGMIPYVGTPILLADTISSVTDKVDRVQDNLSRLTYEGVRTLEQGQESLSMINDIAVEGRETLSRIRHIADLATVGVDSISNLLTETISSIGNTFKGLIHGVDILYNLLLDIIIAWMEKSWKVVGIAIVRFLGKFALNSMGMMDRLMTYATRIADFIANTVASTTPTVQSESESYTYVGILAGLVGTLLGVTLHPQDWYGSFARNLGLRLTSATGVAYLVHVMNFVKQTFNTIRSMFMRAMGYVSPEARALQRLSESSEMIDKFVREAQIMTSESNMALINQPAFRRRFWFTVLQAHQIQRMLCVISTNVVSYQLSKLCSDVIKLGNEKFLDLSASPVRFEPIVICIEGEPGVGKSHATEALVEDLLAAINLNTRSSEKIYYRTAGEKFWSGYRDQPVVVYDEWLNTTDPTRNTDQIAEFMKLKSTAIFVPEMAHLEEKKIRGNPLIIILCCNTAFPTTLANYATFPRAVLRRRDVVLRAERTTEFKGVNPINCSSEQKEAFVRYDHLTFSKYEDVTNERSLNRTQLPFGDMKHWLVNTWKKYYNHQTEQVRIRMQRLPDYLQHVEGNYALADPFTIFYQLNAQIDLDQTHNVNGFTHYEALETAVTLTIGAIEEGANTAPAELDTEDISWEAARTQSIDIIAGVTTGLAWFGFVPCWIAQGSIAQLKKWDSQISASRTEQRYCGVCLEVTACAFVCGETQSREADAQHTLCLSCYQSLLTFGSGRCPTCRHEHMTFLFSHEDEQNLSVWYQLARKGIRSAEWLCEKLIAYFQWRQDNRGYSLAADLLMGVLSSRVQENFGQAFTISLAYQRYIQYTYSMLRFMSSVPNMLTIAQGDWDDYTLPQTQIVSGPVDVLRPEVDGSCVEDLVLQSKITSLCFHDRIREHIQVTKLVGSTWRVQDPVSRRVLEVPLHTCENNCYIHQQDDPVGFYTTVCEHWLATHRGEIRSLYIDYYNNPCNETLQKIPIIFRASWMAQPTVAVPPTWWEYLSEQWVQYRHFLVYSAAAIGVIASLVGAYNFATRINSISGVIQQNNANNGSPEPQPRSPRRTLDRNRTQRAYFHSENSAPTVFEVVTGYICRNTFSLEIKCGTKSKIMYGTGLFNHFLLVPRHYVKEIKKAIGAGHTLFGWPLAQPQLRAEIKLSAESMHESLETDIAYIVLPPKFPIFKDIRRFLATDEDFCHPITSEGILLANPKSGCELMREIEVDIQGIQDEQVVIDNDNSSFVVKEVLVYNYSKPGVCGSLLLRENHQRPILSMHIAGIGEGISGHGYAVLLTVEALQSLCNNRSVPTQFDDVEYESIEQARFVQESDVHLYYYGSTPPEKTPYVPSKSKLVKSLIHGADGLDTVMEPAILDKKDPRYIHQDTPLSAGIKKHGKLTTDFNPEKVSKAREGLWDLWYSRMRPLAASPKVLTDEEAVVGLDINHYTAMDLSTSAGYPYSLNKQKTRKDQYITVKRDTNLKPIGVDKWDADLLRIMAEKRDKRSQGIVPHTLFVDTLKDEKRLRDKARSLGGTRVFCNSPMDYVIECRKYFMHFIAAFMDQRMDLMHAVGINPTSMEWTWLTNALLTKNGDMCTIDYSNFGPGYNASVAQAAYEIIIRWTLEHVRDSKGDALDERILRCIVYECLQSMHICNNTVYQQGAGSPSGAVFTTTVNTIVNQLYLLIAWEALVPKQALQDPFITFKNNVALFCFGDDGIFSVRNEFIDTYNMKTIMAYFKDYGIVATDANKTDTIKITEKLSEAQFLKRGFKLHPTRENVWLPPLKFESIKSCTQWVWKAENMKAATRDNANAALTELYTHGKEIFDRYKIILNKALRKAKIEPLTGTWEEFDNMFMTEGLEFKIDEYILQN